MRKLMLLAVLALLLVLVPAVPAFAFATAPAVDIRLAVGRRQLGDRRRRGADGRVEPARHADPPGTDVYIGGLAGVPRGLVKTLPEYLLYKVAPTADPAHPLMTYAQGEGVLERHVPGGRVSRRSTRRSTRSWAPSVWTSDFWVPLPGAVGEYELTLYEKFTAPSTDLCSSYFEGRFPPIMYRAGVTSYPFVFSVKE